MPEAMLMVALMAQNNDLVIGPTHLLYRVPSHHDATWWSAAAAIASAAAALLSFITGLVATIAARRSAKASELSYLRQTCPTFSLWISSPETSGSPARLNAKNLGPGAAESLCIWPTAVRPVRRFTKYVLPYASEINNSQYSFGPHIEPGDTRSFTLEHLTIGGPEASYILDWEDAAGNRGQTKFTAMTVKGIGLHPFINGKDSIGPVEAKKLFRRRRLLIAILKWTPKRFAKGLRAKNTYRESSVSI